MTRCNLHGGANPSAKIKAEQMMAIARLPAIEALYTIIDRFMAQTCAACGYPSGDTDEARAVIQACKTVLDRAGMGPSATLELTKQSDGDINLELLTLEERAALVGLLAQIKEIKDNVRKRQEIGAPASASIN